MRLRFAVLAVFLLATAMPARAAVAASEAPQVALTLDDLPVHGAILPGETRTGLVDRIVAILKKHSLGPVHAFVNGFGAETPDGLQALRNWAAAGNEVANHTYSHLDIDGRSIEEYIRDLEADLPFLRPFSSPANYLFFRYPSLHEGETRDKRDAIREYLRSKGYQIGQVTIDSTDWAYTAPYIRCATRHDQPSVDWMKGAFLDIAVKKLAQARAQGRLVAGREVRQILLVHASAFELTVLDELIARYLKAGVRFITLPEALQDPIYSIDTGWVSAEGKTFLDQIAWARNLSVPAGPQLPASQLDRICRE